MKEYGLDHYDDDDVDEEAEEGEEGGEEGGNVGLSSGGLTMFGNLNSLTYHEPNEEDPYLLLPRKRDGSDADDWSVEEREEQEILPTDNLIVTGRVEDEVAQLEVYVYEDDVDNLYVHHDVMLPAIPLAVEWLGPVRLGGEESDGSIQGVGNYVAVGTMDPDIELWNLDVIDSLYPDSVLGLGTGQKDLSTKDSSSGKTKKKSKRRKKANDEYHVDAVLALAANRLQGKLLASASADRTVKLWDLEQCQCAQSYEMHEDKVCALAWHKTESAALLSGSYGGLVVLSDMRAPGGQMPRWTVGSDVEVIRWDIQQQTNFYVSLEAIGWDFISSQRLTGQQRCRPSLAQYFSSTRDSQLARKERQVRRRVKQGRYGRSKRTMVRRRRSRSVATHRV